MGGPGPKTEAETESVTSASKRMGCTAKVEIAMVNKVYFEMQAES